MANGKTPYNEDYNSPYKNNTLRWIIGNAADYVGWVVSHDIDQMKQEVQMQKDIDKQNLWILKDKWKDILEAEKDVFIDKPIEYLTEGVNFLAWTPEANTPWLKRMPTASVIHVDMPNKSEQQTQQTTQWWQPTAQWTQPTTTTWWATSWWTQANQGTNQTSTNTPTFSSVEDVVYYLAQQPWWNSLTEEQRVAMVDDLWSKQAAATWQTTAETTTGETENTTNTENSLGEWYSENVMQNMQLDLQTDTTGDIYGKTTWSSSTAITTNADANSAFIMDQQARMANVQDFIQMDPQWVAYSLSWWDNAFSEQTIRDVKRYAPEFWNLVQDELKKLNAEDVINAIASWEERPNTWQTAVDNVNNWVNSWAESISWTPQQTSYTIQNTQNAMNNNMVANNATQLISSLDAQIEEYKSKISNLRKEANTVFKWDTPDYVVNAYINNRSQKYQAEIEKLEWRRQSALDLYKIELSNYQWGVEMWLKYKQFDQDVENEKWDRWYKEQQLNKANIHWEDWKAYQVNSDWTITQLTDATAYNSYMNDVTSIINWYKARYTAWWWTKTATGYKYGYCGLECEWLSDNFTEMTTWLTMLPRDENWNIISWRTWTYAKEKISYINEEPWVVNIWDIAIAAWWVYDSTYWHTMIVTWWDPNTWIIELLRSNKDWDKYVYSTTDTLSNLYAKWLRWFWNPYKDMVEAGATANGTYWYNDQWILITPMTEKFDTFIDEWVGAKSVAASEYIYDTLYKIIDDNSLATLINSWDFWKMWAMYEKHNSQILKMMNELLSGMHWMIIKINIWLKSLHDERHLLMH